MLVGQEDGATTRHKKTSVMMLTLDSFAGMQVTPAHFMIADVTALDPEMTRLCMVGLAIQGSALKKLLGWGGF